MNFSNYLLLENIKEYHSTISGIDISPEWTTDTSFIFTHNNNNYELYKEGNKFVLQLDNRDNSKTWNIKSPKQLIKIIST